MPGKSEVGYWGYVAATAVLTAASVFCAQDAIRNPEPRSAVELRGAAKGARGAISPSGLEREIADVEEAISRVSSDLSPRELLLLGHGVEKAKKLAKDAQEQSRNGWDVSGMNLNGLAVRLEYVADTAQKSHIFYEAVLGALFGIGAYISGFLLYKKYTHLRD